jgi:hypothetical protein
MTTITVKKPRKSRVVTKEQAMQIAHTKHSTELLAKADGSVTPKEIVSVKKTLFERFKSFFQFDLGVR